MKETGPGSGRRSRNGNMPEDSALELEVGSWRLFLSKKEQTVIIDTTDYHPGLLFLNKEDLVRLLERLRDEPG